MSAVAEIKDRISDAEQIAAGLMRRARIAQEIFADADQARVDEAVRALAWSLYKPEHARELAELAVKDTGLGNVPDKIIKKQRKTFGTLRDLLRAKSVGEIEREDKRGIVKFAKPMGVVGAVTPSTNPGATPVNKAMMAIKGRNAVVIAPSPLGYETTKRTVDFMRAALERTGLPADLVQILPPPVTKEITEALMKAADLVPKWKNMRADLARQLALFESATQSTSRTKGLQPALAIGSLKRIIAELDQLVAHYSSDRKL